MEERRVCEMIEKDASLMDNQERMTQKIINALTEELGSRVKVERYESDEETISLKLNYFGDGEYESVIVTLDIDLLRSAKKESRMKEIVEHVANGFWKSAAANCGTKSIEEIFPYLAIIPMELSEKGNEYKMYIKHEDRNLPKGVTGVLVADASDHLNAIMEEYCENWHISSEVLVQKVLKNMKMGIPEGEMIQEDLENYGLKSVDDVDFVMAYVRENIRYLSTSLLYVEDFESVGNILSTDKILAIFITGSDVIYLDYNEPLDLGYAYVLNGMFDRSGLHASTRRVYSIDVNTRKIEYVDPNLLKEYFEMNYVPPVVRN